jgi:hypothetical protein
LSLPNRMQLTVALVSCCLEVSRMAFLLNSHPNRTSLNPHCYW